MYDNLSTSNVYIYCVRRMGFWRGPLKSKYRKNINIYKISSNFFFNIHNDICKSITSEVDVRT